MEYCTRVWAGYKEWLMDHVPVGAQLAELPPEVARRAWERWVALELSWVLGPDLEPAAMDALRLPARAASPGGSGEGFAPSLLQGGQIKWATGGRVSDGEVADFLMTMSVLPCKAWTLVMPLGTSISVHATLCLSAGALAIRPERLELDARQLVCQLEEWRARRREEKAAAESGGGLRPHSQLAPLPHQERAVELFFRKASPARALRFDLACGAGKPFLIGLILKRDLERHAGSRHVVILPWRDMAQRMVLNLRSEPFNLNAILVGDAEEDVDDDAQVLVCAFSGAKALRGLRARIKIVDDAHQLEGSQLRRYRAAVREGVPAELPAEFGTGFRDKREADFAYGFDAALQDSALAARGGGCGQMADLVISPAPLPPSEERQQAMARLLKVHHLDWCPALVFYSRPQRAEQMAKRLRDLGVQARLLDTSPAGLRKLRQGRREEAPDEDDTCGADVFCASGVLSDHLHMPRLRTVVFGDLGQALYCQQQLTALATRWHPSKAFGNFVLPFSVQDEAGEKSDKEEPQRSELTELSELIRSLSRMSPQLRVGILSRRRGRVRAAGLPEVGQELEQLEPEALYTQVFDHLCRCLGFGADRTWERNVDRLRTWVGVYERIPNQSLRSNKNEVKLARWLCWAHCKFRRREVSVEQLASLREIQGMDTIIAQWEAAATRMQPKRPMAQTMSRNMIKCQQLKLWSREHKGILPRSCPRDKQERLLGVWLRSVQRLVQRGELTGSMERRLEQIPAMKERLQLWRSQPSTPRGRSSAAGGVLALAAEGRAELSRGRPPEHRAGGCSRPQPCRSQLVVSGEPLPTSSRAELRCGQLLDWVHAHGGRLPKARGDQEEKSLSYFLGNLQGMLKRTRLSDNMLHGLLKLPEVEPRLRRWAQAGILQLPPPENGLTNDLPH